VNAEHYHGWPLSRGWSEKPRLRLHRRAERDGRTGVRLIDPGNIVYASDSSPIVTLTLIQPSAAIFTLSARSLDDVPAAFASGPVEVTGFIQDKRASTWHPRS
jgi:hypothetical protein